MSSEPGHQAQDRFDQILELKRETFLYEPVCKAIADDLMADEQFRVLLVLSEQSRQFVDIRSTQVGFNDQLRGSIAECGESLDEALHRRAEEVITKTCASYVRQDERWMGDNTATWDSTEIQASFDAIDRALRWLDNHEEIVERLDVSYPEDKW